MTSLTPEPDLAALLASWMIALKGEQKSQSTQKVYRSGVVSYLSFCEAEELPAVLTKDQVRAWMASLGEVEPATARLRLAAVKRFAGWLSDEEGLNVDGVLLVKPPRLDQKAVDGLDADEIRGLLKACEGPDVRAKRDKAMLMLFTETGLRAAEMLALDVDDISLTELVLVVRRGEGGKGRRVRLSASTAAAVDRYVRARRASSQGASEALWVGHRGRLSYTGCSHALRTRAELAE